MSVKNDGIPPAAGYLAAFLPILALCTPLLARAEVLPQVVSVFNIFVGLMLVAALLTYGLGAVMWAAQLNSWPSFRTNGTKVLEWAVVILFVLVVLLGIVQFFRDHPQAATYAVSVLFVLFVIWLLVKTFASGGGEEEKKSPGRH